MVLMAKVVWALAHARNPIGEIRSCWGFSPRCCKLERKSRFEQALACGWVFCSSLLFGDFRDQFGNAGDEFCQECGTEQDLCQSLGMVLDLLDRLGQAEAFQGAAAEEREPMCDQHAQQLRLEFTQDSTRLQRRRDLNASQAVPAFEQQLDLPPDPVDSRSRIPGQQLAVEEAHVPQPQGTRRVTLRGSFNAEVTRGGGGLQSRRQWVRLPPAS